MQSPQSELKTLSVPDFLRIYETERTRFGWVDVRSEGEFEKGALPGFQNLPILNDSERHLVGLTYKKMGQAEAVKLGHRLVDPVRPQRVGHWKSVADSSPARESILICWRGGMRSRIAAQWLRESGAQVRTVEGGFKAIRGELLRVYAGPYPRLLILAGLTGSGKTELLKQVRHPKIDLEALANHRGSSFGRKIGGRQPSQATFENLVSLELRRAARETSSAVLLEDESVSIGSCFLNPELKLSMNASECVWVESQPQERATRIYKEYIEEPLVEGVDAKVVFEWMLASLERIQRKLGGLETGKIHRLIEIAFQRSDEQGFRSSHHEEWISRLLELYYDPMYTYGFDKHVREAGRKIAFHGTIQECEQWLSSRKR